MGDFAAGQDQGDPGAVARWARALLWNWWAGEILALRRETVPSPADEAFLIRRAGWARSHRMGSLRVAPWGDIILAIFLFGIGTGILVTMSDVLPATGFFRTLYGIFCHAMLLTPLFMLAVVVMRFLARRVMLPLWLTDALSLSAPHAGMALDLWMVGLTGRDVAMGLWQEARRRGEACLVAQGLIVVPAAGALLAPLVGAGWGPALVLGVPILLLAVYTAGQWALMMSALHGLMSIDMVVGSRLEGWRAGSRIEIGNTVIAGSLQLFIVVLSLVVGIGAIHALSGLLAMLFGLAGIPPTLIDILHMPMTALALAVAMHLAQRPLHDEAARRVRVLAAEANLPFDLMIAARVLDDPEFARWARWKHETPYIPLYAPVGAMETARPGATPPPTAGWEG